MGYREVLESYLSLSRKELQVLCKNNNVPANGSHTQLAKLLAAFSKNEYPSAISLKENSISRVSDTMPKESKHVADVESKAFVGLHERGSNFVESGCNKILLFMEEKEVDDKRHFPTGNVMAISSHRDHQASGNVYSTSTNDFCTVNIAPKQFDCSTSEAGNGCLVSSVAASIQQIKKDKGLGSEWHTDRTFNELKECSEPRDSCQIALNPAASKNDTHTVPSVTPREAKSSRKGRFLSLEEVSTKETPSFQFFVMSEDGIDLFVDLNSNPSEWADSLKDEMCINLKMQESNTKHSGVSSAETDAHMKISECATLGIDLHGNRVDRSDHTTSTLSSDSENCQSVAAQPDATFASSDSSVLTSSSIPLKMPGYLDGNQVIPSCATPLSGEKRMVIDSSSCPGDGSAFSEDIADSSSRREKIDASSVSMALIRDTSMPNPEGSTNTEQMECSTLKIDDALHTVETIVLGTSLASIPEENNHPNGNETEETLTFDMRSLEKDTDACKVSIKQWCPVGPSEVAVDHDRLSDFCGHGGHLLLDCAATGTCLDAFNIKTSFAKDPISVLNHEMGKSTQTEEKEISECSRSETISENNPKRALSPKSREEFNSKRHHSNENKHAMMVNLRSTRTSAKETAHPRQSMHLLEGR